MKDKAVARPTIPTIYSDMNNLTVSLHVKMFLLCESCTHLSRPLPPPTVSAAYYPLCEMQLVVGKSLLEGLQLIMCWMNMNDVYNLQS